MFNRLNITARLAITAVVPAVVLATVIVIGVRTFGNVKIGSEPYRQVIQTRELVADFHRPAASVLESYLLASQLATYKFKAPVLDGSKTEDPTTARTIADLRLKLQANEREFFDRHDYWRRNLAEVAKADAKKAANMAAALDTSYQTGTDFFAIIDQELLPKIDSPIAADTVSSLLATLARADAVYVKHREAVASLDQDASSLKEPLESKVNDDVSNGLASLLLLSITGLGAIMLVGFVVGRSIRRPINRLTDAATATANVDLPAAVDAIRRGETDHAIVRAPLNVGGGEELRALADAFESMRVTALDLAGAQAKQRLRFAELFVNLGRRTQSLVGRTLGLLTNLEKEERNPEVLENLFKLDHLLTRMRRNASSLLVLAGAEPPRSWGQPIDLIDVVRGAVSEIEAYQRVTIEPLPLVRVKAAFTADLAHLVAELLENATLFSPPQTDVRVLGRRTEEGYLLSIVDEGIGMTVEEYEDANRRITEAASLDQVPSRVLGLHVVGRLAHRMGVLVRLAEAPAQGSVARVLLPFNLTDDPAGEDLNDNEPVAVAAAAVSSAAPPVPPAPSIPPAPPVAAPVAGESRPMPIPTPIPIPMPEPPATAAPAAAAPSTVLPPPASEPAAPRRRVRGASAGATTPVVPREAAPARDAGEVRDALSDLQSGIARGRNDAAELVERPVDDPFVGYTPAAPAFQVPPPAPLPAVPVARGDQADDVATPIERVAPVEPFEPVEPVEDASASVPPPAPTEPRRRVRGAQMFDGGRRDRGVTEARSADDVRSALSSYQAGQERGQRRIEEGEFLANDAEGTDEQ